MISPTLDGDDMVISSHRRGWLSTSFGAASPDMLNTSGRHTHEDDEEGLMWAAIERLPSFKRMRKSVLKHVLDNGKVVVDEVDITNLGSHDKKLIMDSLLKTVEDDNGRFLQRLRQRIASS
ncbi:hypothetical protein RIF29_39771 [Crotalaria pallida]|uniref:Uncharacterized protein n=1 Tax=Crotalaria pallida TaxID=3830 RepID=A0AAN9E860_CROPI